MSEIQHITLVGRDTTSMQVNYMRSGLPEVVLRVGKAGRVESFDPEVMRVNLGRKEIRGFGDMLTRLADMLDAQTSRVKEDTT